MPATIQKIETPKKYRAVDTSTSLQAITVNLIDNGGFEEAGDGDPDFWENWTETAGSGTLANETTNKYAGSDAAKLTTSGGNQSKITQSLNVNPVTGNQYRLTFWTRGDGSSGQIRVKGYDACGNGLITNVNTGVTGTTYTKKTYYFTAECDGSATVQFQSAEANGDGYVDEVEVYQVESFGNNNHGQI